MRKTMFREFRLLAMAASIAVHGCGGDQLQDSKRSLDSQCAPDDAFSYAICVCDDLADIGELSVTKGPSGPGSVGVNGNTAFVNQTQIEGDLVCAHDFQGATDTVIAQDMHAGGNAMAIGRLQIGGDLSVGGVLTAVGPIQVAGALRVDSNPTLLGSGNAPTRAPYTPLSHTPCGCDAARFDVAGAVAKARGNNDNATVNLDHLIGVGQSELTLTGGRYYFANSATVGKTRFVITGPTSIYVQGDLLAVGTENFEIRSGGSLDLYVAGVVATVGELQAGAPGNPSAFRMYLGGSGQVMVNVGQQDFFGSIYAPDAVVLFVGATNIEGAVFARQLAGVGRLGVRYAGSRPNSCEAPPSTPPTVAPGPPPASSPPPETPPAQPAPAPPIIP